MQSKDVRNAIISLIVLAAGVKAVMIVSATQLVGFDLAGLPDFVQAVDSLGTLLILAFAALAVILIPFYVYKRRQEKKTGPMPTRV
jgi:hypothetical protein